MQEKYSLLCEISGQDVLHRFPEHTGRTEGYRKNRRCDFGWPEVKNEREHNTG
jgi:hypothetical protein